MTGTSGDSAAPQEAAESAPDVLVSEVFSAIQGEAALVGERQVFVRLTGCNIRCTYCDQPEALERVPGPCRIEQTAGRRDWSIVTSPLGLGQLVESVATLWDQVPHHSISLTGGEPLLQRAKVEHLLAAFSRHGWPVMLETNGTLVPPLERVGQYLDYISMDLKLPSVDGARVDPEIQNRFLAAALATGATTWAKVVIGPRTDLDEFDAGMALVARASAGRDTPVEVFLQPLTPFGLATAAPTPEQVLDLQERALRIHPRVRVIPQTHKAIGQL